MRRLRSDSGAVAVEFALVLLPLVLIVMGIIDFGSAYGSQLSLSSAARDGARVMALSGTRAAATTATTAAAAGLSQAPTIVITVNGSATASCSAGATVTVKATYPLTSLTGMFSSLMAGEKLTGVGVMRCGG